MFKEVTAVEDNQKIFRLILRYFTVKSDSEKHNNIKAFLMKQLTELNPDFSWKENMPETFENAVDLYSQQPITDEERAKFMWAFTNKFMSTGKPVKDLYKLNPEGMRPTLDELIKSKRLQTLFADEQGDILGRLAKELNPSSPAYDGFYTKWTTPETRDEYKQRLLAKRREAAQMYEPQEGVIAATWTTALEAHPEFIANAPAGGSRRKRRQRKQKKRAQTRRK